ncbi:hypothetical protein [Alicyclobacillus shizuokensis]|uniref:hypothetical protein n=1 Tax=Alicyclobacillus shizuokensis TaxID=392014 RepID=UPI0008308013|nr:hypothetical protein [Alicyclobacillus shizuokensis]
MCDAEMALGTQVERLQKAVRDFAEERDYFMRKATAYNEQVETLKQEKERLLDALRDAVGALRFFASAFGAATAYEALASIESKVPREWLERSEEGMSDVVKWYDFEGDRSGCDDWCRGWDGTSYRCDCGNRRVSWACSKRDCVCNAEDENCPNRVAAAW